MKFSSLFKALALPALVLANADLEAPDATVPTIEISGNKFFYSNNGSQFYIRGVAYQQDTSNSSSGSGYTAGLGSTTFIDPLADGDKCKRDIPYLLELKTNVIRVYAINTTVSHKECMDAFAEAGIYVVSDLSQPSESINRNNPEWNVELFNRYIDVVDTLSNYTNVLGFFAGNEVTNNVTNSDASPFVKAAVRDVKAYIKDQGYRQIPVGYSSNDDAETRVAIANFFVCGDEEERVDFYGINMYSWCGDSSFQRSGYQDRTEEFSNLTVPLFFSEYGCNEVQPREFTDVPVLFSDEMTDVWSGGIIYMYFQEANDYGLVSIDADGDVQTLDDFNNLKSRMATISPTSATSSSVEATTLSCPAEGATWSASPSLPPTPRQDVCDCLDQSFTCVVNSDVDSDDYGDIFGFICGASDVCSGISTNGTTGVYGAFSFCDDSTKLSYVMDAYYRSLNSRSSACDFDGQGELVSSSAASSCSAIISNASESGSVASGSSTRSTASSSSGSATASSSATNTGSSAGTAVRPSSEGLTFVVSSVAVMLFSGLVVMLF